LYNQLGVKHRDKKKITVDIYKLEQTFYEKLSEIKRTVME